MRRREFFAMVGGAALCPLAARAQKRPTLGIMMNGAPGERTPQSNLNAFLERLRALGWVDGGNLHIEYRWNGGSADRARTYTAELIKLAPDVILSASTTNLKAFSRLTSSVPIVFIQVSDPITQGFVTSLTHPGGNITGFSAYEFSIGGKWVELLKEIVPNLVRVGVMSNPDTSPQTKFFMRAIEAAASRFGINVVATAIRNDADIRQAVAGLAGTPPGGLIMPTDTFTRLRQGRVAELANESRVPTISAHGDFVDEGGLMFYGAGSQAELISEYQKAASYVDRILKGTKPGDLPIQTPEKFELGINRKTAAALGLEIPPKLLFTADRVIE
jgi:putative ABC transport system substrate-binding protein